MNARKTALKLAMVIGAVGMLAATADRAFADRGDYDRGRTYDRHDGGWDRDRHVDRDRDRENWRDRHDWRNQHEWRKADSVVLRSYPPRVFAPVPLYAPQPTYVRPHDSCGTSTVVRSSTTIIRIVIGG